jgi:hypothetical protein
MPKDRINELSYIKKYSIPRMITNKFLLDKNRLVQIRRAFVAVNRTT